VVSRAWHDGVRVRQDVQAMIGDDAEQPRAGRLPGSAVTGVRRD
jgi:hypothetical protein